MHDVSTTVAFDVDATWSAEMADPVGGEVFCHNDVCPENVVFRWIWGFSSTQVSEVVGRRGQLPA
jgi:thiamine kinase-like enzyme